MPLTAEELEWKHKVGAALLRDIPELDDEQGMAEALIGLNELMVGAPDSVLTSYDTLSDHELDQWADRWERMITDSRLEAVDDAHDVRTLSLRLGGLIRAWDWLLLASRSHFGLPASEEEWRVGEWYVIPRKRRSQWRQPKLNQGYRVRGILHHRLIPRRAGELSVKPVLVDSVETSSEFPRSNLGAAFFRDFDIKLSRDKPNTFFASSVNSDQHEKDIKGQLDASSADHCFAIVWPELTMPEHHRMVVRRTLKENVVSDVPRVYPDVVVAGSWHEIEHGRRYNVTYIYNRVGKEIARYRKSAPYSDGAHGVEDIELGADMPLIVTETTISAFAVCKDFCTSSRKVNPYHELAVDYVIVPSMGRRGTMIEHQSAADLLRNKTGARAFVVQQQAPHEENVAAFVLPPDRTKGGDAISMENGKTWAAFGWG